jgi:hypothetical protein
MSYIIVVLLLTAVLHFIYESILAPSFRLALRFELFSRAIRYAGSRCVSTWTTSISIICRIR